MRSNQQQIFKLPNKLKWGLGDRKRSDFYQHEKSKLPPKTRWGLKHQLQQISLTVLINIHQQRSPQSYKIKFNQNRKRLGLSPTCNAANIIISSSVHSISSSRIAHLDCSYSWLILIASYYGTAQKHGSVVKRTSPVQDRPLHLSFQRDASIRDWKASATEAEWL